MEPETGKRIVSKIPGRKQTGLVYCSENKEALTWNTLIVQWAVTVNISLCIGAALSAFLVNAIALRHLTEVVLIALCMFFPIIWFSISTTRKKIVTERNPSFYLTNTNIGGLPDRQTLVRASEEPLQAQEGVLLRATAEGKETPPEQLVRASVGTE